jgi:hypothetical protein
MPCTTIPDVSRTRKTGAAEWTNQLLRWVYDPSLNRNLRFLEKQQKRSRARLARFYRVSAIMTLPRELLALAFKRWPAWSASVAWQPLKIGIRVFEDLSCHPPKPRFDL